MFDELAFRERIAISGTEYSHRPIEELLDVAEGLRVRHLELWIPHNFAFEDLSRIEKELSRRDLHAAAISTWTQLNLPGDVGPRKHLIRQSIDAAKALGARSVNTYLGAHPDRTPEQAVQAYRENIIPLTESAEAAGVYITLENEFETTGRDLTREAEGVLRLMEAVNSPFFRLNFDPCNFYFAGEEPYPYAYKLLQRHIGYVHLKDGMKFHPRLSPDPGEGFLWKDLSGDYVCCTLGKGAIPYGPLLRDIVRSSYEGYFALEPHVPPLQLFTTFEESLRSLRQMMLLKDQGETP